MAKPTENKKHITIFVIIVFFILIAGLGAFKFKDNLSSLKFLNSPSLSDEEKQQQQISSAMYHFSSSSQGALIRLIEIDITFYPNNWASAYITPEQSSEVRANQQVVLYDKFNNTMPIGGLVKMLREQGDKIELAIGLPNITDANLLSNKASIITYDVGASIRFPLESLQFDKNINPFVWTAEKTEKTGIYLAKKIWVDNPVMGTNGFIPGRVVPKKSLVILNPDEKIKEGETYKMAQLPYEPAPRNPILQASFEYERARQKQIKVDLMNKYRDCISKSKKENAQLREITKSLRPDKGSATSSSAGSCAQAATIDGKVDPMAIFNDILSRQPAGSPSNCGGAGSAQNCGTNVPPPPSPTQATEQPK